MVKYGGWLIIIYSVLLAILILLKVLPSIYLWPIWWVGMTILVILILRAKKKQKELESKETNNAK